MSKSKILFKLTGSIACYKACYVISKLVSRGFEVQTVCTPEALKFIGPATLSGLTGKPVLSDVFESCKTISHVSLPKWADLAIICPATANIINQLAGGLAKDLIGSLFLAYDLKKPYLIAPAMNHRMFEHPATRASLEKLKGWNVKILETEYGRSACGDEGYGRLLDPEKIYQAIMKTLGHSHENPAHKRPHARAH